MSVPPQTEQLADTLRADMPQLAQLWWNKAARAPVDSDQLRAMELLADEPITAAALCYADLLSEGILFQVGYSNDRRFLSPDMRRARTTLHSLRTHRMRTIQARHEQDLQHARSSGSAPDYLAARVMRYVGGKSFVDALGPVLRRHGLGTRAIDQPDKALWSWLKEANLHHRVPATVPAEVLGLRSLSERDFLRALTDECHSTSPNSALSHPALVERWARIAAQAESSTQLTRTRAKAVIDTRTKWPKDSPQVKTLQRACVEYAWVAARRVEAQLLVQVLRIQAVRLFYEDQHQAARARCLAKASNQVAATDHKLQRTVLAVCAEHRAGCEHAHDPHPCQDCARGLSAEVRRRLAAGATAIITERPAQVRPAAPAVTRPAAHPAQGRSIAATAAQQPAPPAASPPAAAADSPPAGPNRAMSPTPWLAVTERDSTPRNLRWSSTLHRSHLDGGWCPLPEDFIDRSKAARSLLLRLEHIDRDPAGAIGEQNITLRHVGGEWNLRDIRWPTGVLPGVVVKFRWSPHTAVVTARTDLLRVPVLVDDVEYLHRHDVTVVTREAAPGADDERPDLSDSAWVLRTLRRLGHLSADGSATLAADALTDNCLQLGMPKTLVARLSRAIERLLHSGQICTLQGSQGSDMVPCHPPRLGQTPIELLHYKPRVRSLDPEVRLQVQHAWQHHRDVHTVAPFVRRLPEGAVASDEQIEHYHEARRSAHVVDRPLPDSHTFVRSHRRGGPGQR